MSRTITGTIVTEGTTRALGMYGYVPEGATDVMFEVGEEMIEAGVLLINRGSITTNTEFVEVLRAVVGNPASSGSYMGTAYIINYGSLVACGRNTRGMHATSDAGNAFAINKAGGSITANRQNRARTVDSEHIYGIFAASRESGNAEARNEAGGVVGISGASDSDADKVYGIYSRALSGVARSVNAGQLTIEDTGVDSTTSARVFGVYAYSSAMGNAEVINSGDVRIEAANSGGLYAINDANAAAIVTNSGDVTVIGESAWGIYAQAAGAGTGVRAEVVNSGTVHAEGSDVRGIFVWTNPTSTTTVIRVTNEGVSRAIGAGSEALFIASPNSKFEVENGEGAELYAEGTNSYAVYFLGGSQDSSDPNDFVNMGTITGDLLFRSYTGDNPPVAHHKVTNEGEIFGDVSFREGNDRLVNTAEVVGDVRLGDGNDVLENGGMISGMVDFRNDNDRLVNTGEVVGDVRLGGGDDVLELMPGSVISGTVLGGGGMDTLMVAGGATIDMATEFREFDQVDLQGAMGGSADDAPIILAGVGSRAAAAGLSALGIEPIPAPGGVARSTYLFQRQLLNTAIRARGRFDWDRAVESVNTWGELVFRANGAGSGGSKYDVDAVSYLAGMDYKFRPNWDAALAVGLSSAEADGQLYGESTDLGGGITALASATYDNSFWRVELSGGLTHYADVDITRPVLDPTLAGRSARGEFDVTQTVVQADVSWQGHKAWHEGWGVVPRVFFGYGKVYEDGYAERSGVTIQDNLARIGKRESNFADAGIDVELHWDGQRTGSAAHRFPVTARVGLVHLLNANIDSVTYQTAMGSFTRVTEGLGIGNNRIEETGIKIGVVQGPWSLSIGCECEFTSGYEAHSGIAILNVQLQ